MRAVLFVACCLMLRVSCAFVVWSSLCFVRCALFVVCWFVVCWLVCFVCSLELFVVCCVLLIGVTYVLFCCVLFGVCCWCVFVVCCSLVVDVCCVLCFVSRLLDGCWLFVVWRFGVWRLVFGRVCRLLCCCC